MSQLFDEKGKQVPLTSIEAGPCRVIQMKTKEKDGYEAVQVGFVAKTKHVKKTEKGKEFKYLREYRLPDIKAEDKVEIKVGDKVDASVFQEGDNVKISGISKGKGFAGVVKRFHTAGRPRTHGTKHEERAPGSSGASTPSRVVRGRKMPGRSGGERVTVSNLKIVKIDKENNLIAVKGAVPGKPGTLLEIRGQ